MKTKFAAMILMIVIMISSPLSVQAAAVTGSGTTDALQYGRTVTAEKISAEGRAAAVTSAGLKNGWNYRDGNWYYVRGGRTVTGWLKDGGKWYYLSSGGAMKTGWLKDDGKWYYLTKSGAMKTGWLYDEGKWYYLSKNGAMKTGWLKDRGKWYYLTKSGAMKTGWLKDGGERYYLTKSGAMKTGWLRDGGNWYYFKANGAMKKGWIKISGKIYYMMPGGERKTGWLTLSGKKYYFDDNGVLDLNKSREADDQETAQEQAAESKSSENSGTSGNSAAAKNTQAAKSNAKKTKGEQVAEYALQFVGNPYVYGGCSLTKGTDCSGFVMLIYQHFGVSLPHYDAAIREKGTKVNSLKEARAGDIICYYGHVAIYLGDGRIVHASNSRDGIKISERADYRTIAGIRRIFN